METRANYVAIGVFTLAVMAAGIGFIYWLNRFGDGSELAELTVYVREPVSGIIVGSPVYFNGIKVGEVTYVKLDEHDPILVTVRSRINTTTPLRADSRAKIGVQGLTGIAYIDLSGGTKDKPNFLASSGAHELDAEVSGVQDLIDNASDMMSRVNTIVERIDGFVKQNEERLASTVDNVEAFTGALANNSDKIETLVEDVSSASRQIADLSEKLQTTVDRANELVAAVEPETVRSTIANVEAFTGDLAETGNRIDTMLNEVEVAAKGVRTFTDGLNETMANVDGIVDQAKTAADGVTKFTDGLNQTLGKVDEVITAVDAERINGAIVNIESASAKVAGAAEKAEDVLAAVDPAKITETVDNVSSFTKTLTASGERIDGVLSQAEKAAEGIADISTSLRGTLEKVDNVVAAVKPENVENAIVNIETASAKVAGAAEKADKLIEAVDPTKVVSAVDNIEVITEKLAGASGRVDGVLVQAERAADGIVNVANGLENTLKDVDGVVAAIDPEQITSTVTNIQQATGKIDKVATRAEEVVASLDTEKINKTLANVETFSQSLANASGDVDALVKDARSVAGELTSLAERLSGSLERFDALVEAVNPESVKTTVDNVAEFSETLAKLDDGINSVVDSAREASENVSEFTKSLSGNTVDIDKIITDAKDVASQLRAASGRVDGILGRVDGLLGSSDADGLFAEARDAIRSIKQVSQSFEARAGEISNGLARFSGRGLGEIETFINDGRRTLTAIERAASELEKNPQRLLFGNDRTPKYRPRRH